MYFPQEPKCDPHPPQLSKQPCTPFIAKRFQPSLCMVHRSVQLHFSTLFRQKLWPTIMGKMSSLQQELKWGWMLLFWSRVCLKTLACGEFQICHVMYQKLVIIYIYIYMIIWLYMYINIAMLMIIGLHWKGETSLDPDRLYYRSANFWVKSTFRSVSKLSLNHTKPQMFP